MTGEQDAVPEEHAPALKHTGLHWPLRRITAIVFIALVIAASIWGYNIVATTLAHRWDATQDRDPESGILAGAEAINLGAEDADAAVLLVHGFIGAATNFGDLPEKLADAGYRVRAMRLPGHGTTPFELRETTPDSELLEAVLAELELLKETHRHVFIVGHSMGGALSALAASESGADGLVLAAPYFRVTHQWYYVLRPETWTSLTAWAVKWVYKGDTFIRVNRPESKEKIVSYRWVPTEATRAADRLANQARSAETLENITCPVLMLHSPDDFAASPRAAQRAFEMIGAQEKKLIWLDNSDHHLFWDYDREEAIVAVLDFIEEVLPH